MKPLFALLGLTVLSLGEGETAADAFNPKRGMNTEIWVDWLTLDEMLTTPGFLEVYPDYPRHMPPDRLARLPAEGFDFLRIAVDPAPLLALAGTDREDGLLAQLRLRVEEAQAVGLKVILDLHTHPKGEDFDVEWALANDENFAAYVAMAGRVAATLDGLPPESTALQLMNEPTQDCDALSSEDPSAATWAPRLKQLHAGARAQAPELPLVLSGACWGGAWALSFLDPTQIDDANVLWSVHSYDPFSYSHQGVPWTDDILQFLSGIPYPPSMLDDATAERLVDEALERAAASDSPLAGEATEDALMAILDYYREEGDDAVSYPLEEAAVWADTYGIPRNRIVLDEFGGVWIDEAGAEFDADGHMRHIDEKRRAAEERGIGWAVWSWRGNMRVGAADGSYDLDPRVCVALGLPPC